MTTKTHTNMTAAMGVAFTVFFMAGFFTCLNGILVPRLKTLFELSFAKAMLVQLAFFGAYFLLSLPAGRMIASFGYKKTIIFGLILTGLGSLGFWPAAAVRLYPAFLATLFILAAGVTLLQVSANPFVSLLGPEQTASSRLTLAQGFNSLGTTIAPIIGGWFILSGTSLTPEQLHALPVAAQNAYHAELAAAVQHPYLVLGLLSFFFAFLIYILRFPSPKVEADEPGHQASYTFADVFRYPHAIFGVLGIFTYVGAEVSIGSLMVNFFTLPQIGGFSEAKAAGYASIYWALAMVGRFIGSPLLARVSPRHLLGLFAVMNVLLLLASVALSGTGAVYALVSIGLFNSIMFPTIFTLGIAQLGPLASRASSLIIMATMGGAIIPYIQGRIADFYGLQISFLMPALCYIYIAFFGFWGARVRRSVVGSAS